jgi:hypothetical protein
VSAPLYRDELWHGASDPTVIRREGAGAGPDEWWMFYTQRRALLGGEADGRGGGVEWVHGSRIGVAVSNDSGATWRYRGVVDGLDEPGSGPNTHWAPEVVRIGGKYHMYLTWIEGIPTAWAGHDRHIVHFVSDDFESWRRVGRVLPDRDAIIDAAVAPTPDGRWRMWFKDERRDSTTWSALSDDGYAWTPEGLTIDGRPHEGPNVFALAGHWWLIVDEWRGQGVYRSSDQVSWRRQPGLILADPGSHPSDRRVGRHADVVVLDDDSAIVFYFTHPEWDGAELASAGSIAARRTVVHAALVTVDGQGRLRADRDAPHIGHEFLPRN